MSKIATLNKSRHGVFYVRRIYKDAQNKRHIQQISLKTKDPALARVLALKFALQQHAQTMEKKNPSLFDAIREQIAQPLKITTATGEVLDFDPSNPAEAQWAREEVERARTHASTHQAPTAAPQVLAEADRQKLAATEQEFRQAEAEAMRYRANLQAITPTAGAMLADALQQHLEEEKRRGFVAKTILEKRGVFADFLGFLGNVPINDITRERIGMRNGWRDAEYKATNGKAAQKTRAANTLEKRRAYLKKFFDWANDSGKFHRENPMSQLMATKAEIKSSARENRYAEFTDGDIKALFGPDYAKQANRPDRYWMPLLALFTGARIAELARLELSTFEEVDGVKCFQILDTKADSGLRTVPIHSQLLALGLWDYAQALKNRGEVFLMPHRPQDPPGTPKARRKASPEKMAGKWWGEWVDECGITNTRKVFHSFRSTAITDLHNANAGHAAIKRAVGHATEGMTGAHAIYVRGIELKNIQTAIELIQHPQVDFEAIKLADPTFSAYFAKAEVNKKDPKTIDRAQKLARHEAAKAAREERNRDKRKTPAVKLLDK